MVSLVLALQLWNSYISPQERANGVVLHGFWQSCRGDEGYEERIYDYHLNGKHLWSFHMGPYKEFALFKGSLSEDTPHESTLNLLGPAYTYNAFKTKVGGRNWSVPTLHLKVNVVETGGSREECEAYVVKVEIVK